MFQFFFLSILGLELFKSCAPLYNLIKNLKDLKNLFETSFTYAPQVFFDTASKALFCLQRKRNNKFSMKQLILPIHNANNTKFIQADLIRIYYR